MPMISVPVSIWKQTGAPPIGSDTSHGGLESGHGAEMPWSQYSLLVAGWEALQYCIGALWY